MNSMLRKELRDTLRWAPVGLIMLTVMIVYAFRQPSYYLSLSNQLYFFTWLCASAFGLLLGLATFLLDEREAARAFLVHRGISLETIFRRRVWVGLSVYAVTMFTPIVCTAIYLANTGPLYAPVTAWQAFPAAVAVLSCSAMYFAGIIVACRPSRWIGTRLLPLGAALAVSVTAACALERTVGWATLFCFFAGTLGVFLIGRASRYAFLTMPSLIGPTRLTSRSIPMFLILTFSALLLCSAVSALPVNLFRPRPGLTWILEFDETGTPWVLTRKAWGITPETQSYVAKAKVTDLENEVQADAKIAPSFYPSKDASLRPTERPTSSWDPITRTGVHNAFIVLDASGYLLVYETIDIDGIRLKCVIGRDRVSQYGEPRGLPFESPPSGFGRSQPYQFYGYAARTFVATSGVPANKFPKLDFINQQGVYEVDLNESKIVTILDRDISLFGELPETEKTTGKFLVQSNGTTTVYGRSEGTNGDASWMSRYDAEPECTIPAMGHDFSHSIWFADSKNWTRVDTKNLSGTLMGFHVSLSKNGDVRSFDYQLPNDLAESLKYQNLWEAPIIMSSIPAVVLAIPLAVTFWANDPSIKDWHLLFLLGQMIVASLFAWCAARHRGFSTVRLVAWTVAGSLLGVGTWLAILAIYPKLVTVACSNCKKKRRVEHENCEHCRAEWDSPVGEGIEIRQIEERIPSVPQGAGVAGV